MVLCNQCGNQISEGLSVCSECGAQVAAGLRVAPQPASEDPNRLPRPQSQVEKRRLSFFGYAGISILLLLIGVCVAILLYQRPNEGYSPLSKQAEPPAGDASPAPSLFRKINNQGRYSVGGCGSIQDSHTGLEWFVGADRNLTWHEAQNWVAGLASCGGSWRMPTIAEIGTLYDPSQKAGIGYYTDGRYFPARVDPVFNGIGGGSWVWSGESVAGDSARSFNLHEGKGVVYSAMNTVYSTRAFAVRSLKK